jgi:acetyl-CoA acyltransferase
MGLTAENVAVKYGITREQADLFSFNSHQKAMAAIEAGNSKMILYL